MLIILIKWLVITIFWEWPLASSLRTLSPGLLYLNLKLSVGPYAIPQCICHNLSWKAQLTQPDTHIEARLRDQQGSVNLPHTRSSHRQFAPSCSFPPDAFVWSAIYHHTSTSVFSFLSSIVCSFSHTNTHTHTSTAVIRCFPPDASIPMCYNYRSKAAIKSQTRSISN